MTCRTLIRRSLRFHARAHAGVVLGAAIGSAALIGALLVGDSVRETLKDRALERLGSIHFAVHTPDRLFESTLRERFISASMANFTPGPHPPGFALLLPSPQQYSALMLPGVVAKQDGSARVNRVNVLGLDSSWPLSARAKGRPGARLKLAADTALINETLARRLGAGPGDEIVARVRRPSALGLDAAISPRDENVVALRLKVGGILPADHWGNFALAAEPGPPANLFLPLEFLAEKVGAARTNAPADGWGPAFGFSLYGHFGVNKPRLDVDGANLLVSGPVLERTKLGWWGQQRVKLANWFLQRARLAPAGAPGPSPPAPRSLALLAAHSLQPKTQAPVSAGRALPWLEFLLRRAWTLEDAGLSVRALEQPQTATGALSTRRWVEVSSSRIFLEPPVVAAALKPCTADRLDSDNPTYAQFVTNAVRFVTNGVGVLTYLANLMRAGDRATPYSMVTAAGAPFVPADMRDDEMLVNEWLADDLQVKPGDAVQLSYYVADSGSRLVERTNSFRVRAVVPIKGLYADRTLMPEFPGLAKAESTKDWDAGFPLVHKLREKDEAYWKKYRSTPKAFVTLAAGQAMWANRFGALTAIRYPMPANADNADAGLWRNAAYRNLRANLNPADVGLRFEPVREQALKAAAQGQDFGQLFLGFSLFLVVAALLLMGLLFQFGLEQRAAEVGTLLALGFTVKQVRRLLLAEGTALALAGGLLGALGGLGYAKAMLWGLTRMWRNAVGGASLEFHATASTLLIGLCASTLVAAPTIWLTLRRQARQPIHCLLAGEVRGAWSVVSRQWSVLRSPAVWVAVGAGAGATAIIGWALLAGERANAGAFFGAGALLLAAGLAAAAAGLGVLARGRHAGALTLGGLSVRGCARRRGRSLATAALLAGGCFVIVAIGVFRLDANRDATSRASGMGGFALLGESALPVAQDLNTRAGREAFGLGADEMAGVAAVPFRAHAGDDASCLNLNRAQRPRLLGVRPELLAGRFTFAGAAKGCVREAGWKLIAKSEVRSPKSEVGERRGGEAAEAVVPAIGDANSIEWALGKKLGDTIDYTDERGRVFKVRLVGAVANSILQGSLIIDEGQFVKRFPNESGYRMFLLDAPAGQVARVSATLSRAMQDTGLELTPAAERLNAFNAVQNTYLGTFQVLGGLGLLLGSAGLGVVVLRNMLERRGELALLTAVGFRRWTLQLMVLSEHGVLLALGLGLGVIAAAVAVLPSLLTPGARLPVGSLALTLGAVLLNGAAWTWLATRYALRGNLLAALRNE